MAKLTYADLIERDQRARALAELGLRFDMLETPKLMPRLVDLVQANHLELLAESRSILGVDGYWLAEDDETKRRLIKGAYTLHRYKGTPWAIREIVRRLGFGEIQIDEGLNNQKHNGVIYRNGLYSYGYGPHWAHYRITLDTPITNDQAFLLRKTLKAFAPARCVLEELDYTQVALRHNGMALRDGRFNKGTA